MTILDCMAAMGKALGRKLSFEEAEVFAERLDAVRKQLGHEGLPDDILSAAQKVREQVEIEKALALRNVLMNKRNYAEHQARKAEMGVDWSTYLTALKVGINKAVPGGRLSIDAQHMEIFNSTLGGLIHDLRAAGGKTTDLVAWMLAKDNALPIAQALRGERQGLAPEAITVADLIDKYREALRLRENRAGGWRGKLEGYISRQMHDPDHVQRAGFAKWRDWMIDNLDHTRTFERDGELIGQLQMEREQVGFHLTEARQTLTDITGSLLADRKAARKAAGRSESADARVTTLEGQVDEAHRSAGEALTRYMELADREREAMGGDPQAPIGVEDPAAARRVGQARAEARVALTRARERLNVLNDQLSGARFNAEERTTVATELHGIVEAARAALGRAEKAIDLFTTTGERLRTLEKRLQRPVADKAAYLQEIYNSIVSDLWISHESPKFDGVHSFVGPSNLAAKRAAHRELHFKDAAAELAYAERFGRGTLVENIVHDLEHTGRAVALMENLSPNPRAMHDRLLREAMVEADAKGDRKAADALSGAHHENQLMEILGETRSGRKGPTMAAWASATRTVINMARLGGATISSLGDVATLAAQINRIGKPMLEAHGEAFMSIVRSRRSEEQRAIADLIGVGMEGLIGTVQGRFSANDNVAGRLARMQQMFFRFNLLNWWTDAHKTTSGLVTASHFGSQVGKSFAELGQPEQRMLSKYGVGAEEWDVIRQSGLQKDENGRAFLTAHGVREASLGNFQSLFADPLTTTERQLIETRDRVATSYGALIRERAEFAVPTPGAAERAIMHQGTPRGTILGEGLRFIMQFKGFPIAMVQKTLGEDIHGQGRISAGSIVKLGFLAVELTAMGYLTMVAKDLLAGKSPRDWRDRETWLAAMLQGGGLGIFGDFLFGENNRFGHSAAATAIGPGFGIAADVAGLFAKTIRLGQERGGTKETNLAADALRVAVQDTPGLNLFYLRPLLNYFFLWPLSEKLNPGWASRFERRVERENGQKFWMKPTEAVR